MEERAGVNTGVVTKRYFGSGVEDGGEKYFYTRDHLGSVREVIDGNGNLAARYDYDPWGRQTQVEGSYKADWGYAGYWVHRPSGLNLTWYRAYDAELGRWLSRDPIGENGGINLFLYVGNAVLVAVDYFGLRRCCISKPLSLTVLSKRNDHTYIGVYIKVTASFSSCADCDPSCCEVRQDVKGRIVVRGKPYPDFPLPPGGTLNTNTFNYDWFGYGLGETDSFYRRNATGGIDFEGFDSPGRKKTESENSLGPGDGVWLAFKLYVWDRCNNRKVGKTLRYGFSGEFGKPLQTWGY